MSSPWMGVHVPADETLRNLCCDGLESFSLKIRASGVPNHIFLSVCISMTVRAECYCTVNCAMYENCDRNGHGEGECVLLSEYGHECLF